MNHYPHDFETHRCHGSLRSFCSIRRYDVPNGVHVPAFERDGMWHLRVLDYDSEYDYHYMDHVARIGFCLFCGKELGAEVDG